MIYYCLLYYIYYVIDISVVIVYYHIVADFTLVNDISCCTLLPVLFYLNTRGARGRNLWRYPMSEKPRPDSNVTTRPAVIIVNTLDFPNRYAAWFGTRRAKAATRAAETSFFNAISIDDEKTQKIAEQLGEGGLSPLNGLSLWLVNDELARELELLIAERKCVAQPTEQAPLAGDPDVATGLPTINFSLWSSLTAGTLVLAADLDRQGAPEAWYEAYVVSIEDDTLMLRWRDFPREGILSRTRKHVALLHPAN
jgi:hypothetical protein